MLTMARPVVQLAAATSGVEPVEGGRSGVVDMNDKSLTSDGIGGYRLYFMECAFVPREAFFRWGHRFHHIRFTALAQKLGATTATLVIAWGLFASVSYVVHTRALTANKTEIADKRLAFLNLEKDLVQTLAEQAELRDRIVKLNGSLADEIRNGVALQSQRDALARQVNRLEQRFMNLRDEAQSAMERLSEQIELGADTIESTVAMTGLHVSDLFSSLDQIKLGQGGPFAEPEAESLDASYGMELAIEISALNKQLNRWSNLRELMRILPLTTPLAEYRVSSGYGDRDDPINGRKAHHFGVDLVAPFGSPIYATAPGKVEFAGLRGRHGAMIEINHGYGILTRYSHLRKILVKSGQEIEHQEKIGLLGSSGRSTGPHLHYEIRIQGQAEDPAKFIKAGKYTWKY